MAVLILPGSRSTIEAYKKQRRRRWPLDFTAHQKCACAGWREREREEMKRKPTWRLWSLMYDQIRFMVSGRDISVTPRNFFRAGDTADTRVSALVAAFAADEPAAAGILVLVLLFSSLLSVCLCLCANSSPISAEKWLARTRKKNAFPVLQAPPKPNFFPETNLSVFQQNGYLYNSSNHAANIQQQSHTQHKVLRTEDHQKEKRQSGRHNTQNHAPMT